MKKITYKIFGLAGFIGVSLWVTSCLKDDRVDFTNLAPVVEMLDAQAGASTALDLTAAAGGDAVLQVRVNVTGSVAPTHDIVLTLGVSQHAVDLYNLDTSHVPGTLLPDSAYTFDPTVTIKAGKDSLGNPNRSAQFTLTIHSGKIPATPGTNYVLSMGILSTSPAVTISDNFGAIMYNFYHNPWDGSYTSTGTRYNFSAASNYTGWDPALNKPLASSTVASTAPWVFPASKIVTVNATISRVHVGNLDGGFGTADLFVSANIDAGTGLPIVVISSNCPANDGSCPLPLTGLASLVPLSGTGAPNSTYDVSTKTFNLYYMYTNATGTFRVLHDVLVHN